MKSAAERLQSAKAALVKLERERDAVMARRRGCVLAGDVAGRRQCDHQRQELELDLQAARDAIDWLPQQAQREAQQQPSAWPSDLPAALAALEGTRAERAHREAIKPVDRSARCQQQIDHFRQREHALTKLIERLRPQESAA